MGARGRGRSPGAEDHLRRASAICKRSGWIPPDVQAKAALAEVLFRGAGDAQLVEATSLVAEVVDASERFGMGWVLERTAALQALLRGEDPARRSTPARAPIGQRMRQRVLLRGRGLIAAWTRALDDEELIRHFGGERAQRAIFRALIAAYRPERRHHAPDLPDFIRLGAGELSSFDLALGEQVEVVGDVIVALRLPDMFGVIGQPG